MSLVFLEAVVNELNLFPVDFDCCWLLLKIFLLVCLNNEESSL